MRHASPHRRPPLRRRRRHRGRPSASRRPSRRSRCCGSSGSAARADWGALWPASATIWQFGNLVPLQITLPGDYLAVAGIDPGRGILRPLARSARVRDASRRSSPPARARAPRRRTRGSPACSPDRSCFAALAALIALTSANDVAAVELWQAILFPSLVFARARCSSAAVVTEWREAGSGVDRAAARPRRGGAARLGRRARAHRARRRRSSLAGLIGLGALARRGGARAARRRDHRALRSRRTSTCSARPWSPSRSSPTCRPSSSGASRSSPGPGFAVGAGTAVSPAGTQLGRRARHSRARRASRSRRPRGCCCSRCCRSRSAPSRAGSPARDCVAPRGRRGRRAGRAADRRGCRVRPRPQLGARGSARPALATSRPPGAAERLARRGRRAAGHGSPHARVRSDRRARGHRAGHRRAGGRGRGRCCPPSRRARSGPGRLAEVGPQPGPVALAVGLEVLLGAAILLLSPRRRPKAAPDAREGDRCRSGAGDAMPRPHPTRNRRPPHRPSPSPPRRMAPRRHRRSRHPLVHARATRTAPPTVDLRPPQAGDSAAAGRLGRCSRSPSSSRAPGRICGPCSMRRPTPTSRRGSSSSAPIAKPRASRTPRITASRRSSCRGASSTRARSGAPSSPRSSPSGSPTSSC